MTTTTEDMARAAFGPARETLADLDDELDWEPDFGSWDHDDRC